ncbi:MAG TPA: superoxide dismutase [Rugosimonospora sp.]|nr:superoxide dismutase [Rugosimonospora sp.]
MRRIVTVAVVALLALGTGVLGAGAPASASGRFPADIPLPNGWQPEGLTVGRGTSFYVGSRATGAVFRGDLATGRGQVLVPGTPGSAKTGLKVDRRNRLWTAGAGGGDATVYDAASGATLAHYTLTTATPTFVNDLVVTEHAVYFTDSQQPFLYVVPVGPGGRPGTASRALALSGPAADAGAFNNGIVATPTGRLIVVQSRLGRLVSVDPRTGASELVDLGGYSVLNGDGLVLCGHTLYTIRNQNNLVAVLRMERSFTAGTLLREVTSPLLRVPSTGDLFGPFLYVVNARFDVTPTPDTPYDVVQLPA